MSTKNINSERTVKNGTKIKRKKKKKNYTALKVTLISLLMVVAMVCGIVAAKWYTTPYSSDVVDSFEEGTLENIEITSSNADVKFNILIMGTDVSGLLTDVLMVAQIDTIKNTASVMSIPRDTYIKYRGYKGKINGVHATYYDKTTKSGSEDTIKPVRELTGIPIHHFVKVNTKAFRQCIDELGGVDFYVPQNMRYSDPAQDLYINLKKGQQHLDGDKAEQLVRFRSYPMGDIQRIQVQQDLMNALIEQKLNIKYVGEIGDIYSVLISNLETSLSPEEAIACGEMLLEIGKENIRSTTLPHILIDGAAYVKPAYEEIIEAREEYFGYDKHGNEI